MAHKPKKVTAADIRARMDETFGEQRTPIALCVIRAGSLLSQYPEHARLVVDRLPALYELEEGRLEELWQALTGPDVGLPQDPRKRQSHMRAVRSFIGKLQRVPERDWISSVSKLMSVSDNMTQYQLVLDAITNDTDRARLVKRLMSSTMASIMSGHYRIPHFYALCEAVPFEIFEPMETRQEWRWAWMRTCLSSGTCQKDMADNLLGWLESFDDLDEVDPDVTAVIETATQMGREQDEEGDGLADQGPKRGDDDWVVGPEVQALNNATLRMMFELLPYDGKPSWLMALDTLLDHGADPNPFMGQDIHEDVRAVIQQHPGWQREQLRKMAADVKANDPSSGPARRHRM